jgi:CRP-like cAMP-binding protein
MVTRTVAERVLSEKGWLSERPAAFRAAVLQRANLARFASGEVVFRFGDPPGGIYGMVSGIVTMTTAPWTETPRLIHLGDPGTWTGEACFVTREPRRVEIRALVDTTLMHLPLAAMDEMAAADPGVARHFARILVASVDILIRVVNDLQKPDATRRIASVLQRFASSIGDAPIPLSQAELGELANASRKQVNGVLARFAAAGCVAPTYRSLRVLDAGMLRRLAADDDEWQEPPAGQPRARARSADASRS